MTSIKEMTEKLRRGSLQSKGGFGVSGSLSFGKQDVMFDEGRVISRFGMLARFSGGSPADLLASSKP